MSENQDDVEYYLEQIQTEREQEPSAIRKSIVRKRNSAFGKAVFGWASDSYNYQATRYGKRYESKEAAPVAGTKAGDLDGGAVRLANPSGESLIRERLRKER